MYHIKQFQALCIYLVFTLFLAGCNGGGGGGGGQNTENGNGNNEVENPPEQTLILESLSLSSIDSTLDINDTLQLEVIGLYSDETTQNLSSQVSWTVSPQDLVSVSSTGLLTALSPGTSLISARMNELSAEIVVKVRALESLSLSPGSVALAINSSQPIQVTGIYTDNSTESLDTLVSWYSENPDIASVSSSGLITANIAGSTQVTAEYAGLSRSLSVTVSSATLQSITVSTSNTQIPAGLSTGFSATGLYTDGSEQNLTDQVEWTVSDTQIASIDSASGALTGLQAGAVNVSAVKENITGSLPFTVSPATLSALQVSPATLVLAKGTSQNLVVTAVFSDLSKQDVSSQVQWISSDENKASVIEGSSQVEALGLGSAMLSASLLDQQVDISVTVSDAELVSLQIWPANATLPLGVAQQFVAQGVYTDNSVQDLSEQVTWLSSNEATAVIGNSDNAHGEVDSLEVGTTVITAVLEDVQQTTELTIEDTLLTSIEILPVKQSIALGTQAHIQAIGHYSNGSRFDITSLVNWNTSSATLISLSQAKEGKVVSLAPGYAILNAELQGKTSLAEIQVTQAILQNISIESGSSLLADKSIMKLVARGYYSDESSRDLSAQVTWQSSNSSIIAVSNDAQSSGLISALMPGQATVTASLGEISADRQYTVSDAVLTNLQISTPADSLNINSSFQASAMATFSDDSIQDVTSQVNWLSSESTIAQVENSGQLKGLIKAGAEGEVQIRASMAGIQSDPLVLQVTADPDAPVSLAFSLQPNVILNNAVDSSEVQIQVLPSQAGGTVADGTEVVLSITEGEETRMQTLSTVNGMASYTLNSSHAGMIQLAASSGYLTVNAGLLSTPGLWQAISIKGFADVIYEEEKLKKDSVFLASVRNLSNRIFDIDEIRIQYRDPLKANRIIQFIESPIRDPEFISDGDLTAAEFSYIGYEMDFDTQARIYQIIYYISDPLSSTGFTLGIEFDFGDSEEPF